MERIGIRSYPWYTRAFWRVVNWCRGIGIYWDEKHPEGPIVIPPGTCPYPLHPDQSEERCVRIGWCGCGAKERK